MDEKTAMNVEFLRARLLSERRVSKTARQRAEMLAQRVMELEQQLRIVDIQRRKAEKAAEEVLSILETQGIGCISGSTDLSTDQEGNQRIISEDVKGDEILTASKMDRSEVDDVLSCSDIDSPPSEDKCLSWKSHGSSLDSQEKQKTKQSRHRQRSGFIFTMKSSQRRPGKSCRKIKRRDAGSGSENDLQKPTLLDAHGNGVVAHSDDFDEKHEYPLEASKRKLEKFSVDSSLSFHPDGRNRESKDVCGKENDMQSALEQQAQLIIQFQAMENAQKEWEEKFNETKLSMLDNPEPDNQAIVAENSNWSADNSKLVGWIPQHEEEEKLSVKDISFTEDKMTVRCRNCEMANKRVASDKFSSGIVSTSLSSPSWNGSNCCSNGLLNPLCEPTAINVIETVSKAFTFPPQDSHDLASKVHIGPIFEKSNPVSTSNLKVHPLDQGVLQCSSKEHHTPDKKKLCGLEIPEIRREHPRHPSQTHGLMEQQCDTMAVNEAKHATQVFTIPSQERLGLVASKQDLEGSIYVKPNTVIHRNSKVNPPEQGILHTSLTDQITPMIGDRISNTQMPEIKELPRKISRATTGSLGSVLQSLEHAKISIRQELVKRPSTAEGTLTVVAPANSPMKPTPSCKSFDVPIGSSALFRLPSDSFPQAQLSRSNVYGSGLRLTATHPDLGLMTSTVSAGKGYLNQPRSASYVQPGSKVSVGNDYVDRYPFNPYMDGMSRVQVRKKYVNHYPTRNVESESQVSTVKDYFDRHSSIIKASSANEHPLYYPGLPTKSLSLHNEHSKSDSDLRRRRMPYSDSYTYHGGSPFSDLRSRMPYNDRYSYSGGENATSDLHAL